MKCKISYKRHSNRYQAGKDYDISKEEANKDSNYFGATLWAGSTKKEEKEEPKEEVKEKATPKKKSRKVS